MLGFRNVVGQGQPLCRWIIANTVVDVMPSDLEVLGFSDKWLGQTLEQARFVQLRDGIAIRVASAPCFLALKLQAFQERGADDYFGSRDIEDIVTIISGRAELIDELDDCDSDVCRFVCASIAGLLRVDRFVDSLVGHLAGDELQYERVMLRLARIEELAAARMSRDS